MAAWHLKVTLRLQHGSIPAYAAQNLFPYRELAVGDHAQATWHKRTVQATACQLVERQIREMAAQQLGHAMMVEEIDVGGLHQMPWHETMAMPDGNAAHVRHRNGEA